MHTIKELRAALKSEGCTVKVKTFSDFKSATVLNSEGLPVYQGYFTPEEFQAHKEKNAKAIEIIEHFKGKVFDGCFRVVVG